VNQLRNFLTVFLTAFGATIGFGLGAVVVFYVGAKVLGGEP